MGTLYLVATPIGNLKDITIRALELFENTFYIACEDTRHTGNLISKLEMEGAIKQAEHKLISFYDDVEFQKIPEIISLLTAGNDVILVSDAGTPTISDPGFKLVRECQNQQIPVTSLPGASSAITALTIAGLPTDKFLFIGYPPQKPGKRLAFFENVKNSLEDLQSTVVFFEAPHKLVKTLQDIETVFGDIELVFARELTKIHESITKEKVSAALKRYEKTNPKGEFVVLFNLNYV